MDDGRLNSRPIGVFDSGLGGLTAVRAVSYTHLCWRASQRCRKHSPTAPRSSSSKIRSVDVMAMVHSSFCLR